MEDSKCRTWSYSLSTALESRSCLTSLTVSRRLNPHLGGCAAKKQIRISNGDPCKAWLTQDYLFPLAPLKTRYQEEYQQDSGAIVLRLAGAPSDLVYEFAHDETTAVKYVSWGQIKDHLSR